MEFAWEKKLLQKAGLMKQLNSGTRIHEEVAKRIENVRFIIYEKRVFDDINIRKNVALIGFLSIKGIK